MSSMRSLPEIGRGVYPSPSLVARDVHPERAAPHLLNVYLVEVPKDASVRALRRPSMVLVDANGSAVACFRDGPFIAHPNLDALLAMHGLGAHELRKATSVPPEALGARTSPVRALPGELQVLRRALR